MTGTKELKYALALGLLLTGGLTGCATSRAPSPGAGDPVPPPYNDPQISVLAPELQSWLAFDPAYVVHVGTGPMAVQVPMRNMAPRSYLVDYRFLFYDANGMELEPTMGWQLQALEPKQLVRLKGQSLTDAAVSYRLEVKWSR